MLNHRELTVARFESHVIATDQLDIDDLSTPLLGLVGEIGSLLSALKKKRRDTDAYFGYQETVAEELGDVLWYVSSVARRGGTSLIEAASRVAGVDIKNKNLKFSELSLGSQADPVTLEKSLLELAGESGDLAKRFSNGAYHNNVDALRGDLVKLIRPILKAASAAEVLLEDAAINNIRKTADRWPTNRDYPIPRRNASY